MSEPYPIPGQPEVEPVASKRVAWRVRDLFLALAGGFVLSVALLVPIAVLVFEDAETAPGFEAIGAMGILIYAALAIAAWYFALKRRGVGWREGGFRPVAGSTLLKMVPVTIGMMLINAVVVALSAQAFGDVPTAQDQIVGDADAITLSEFAWLFVLAAVAAPIVEEFLFRGLLYPLLRGRLKVVAAVASSALLFAFLHFYPTLVPALLTMGIVLAVLTERYDSILPAIVVHALNNGAALLALYAAIGR
jgi:membrane protease YdiL (CAAX protease family)